ncbi:hypothetical protein HN51_043930 [Arachis hypogaea]
MGLNDSMKFIGGFFDFDGQEGAEEDVDNNKNEDIIGEPLEIDDKEDEQPVEWPRKTSKYMTKYERAQILGTRALQISMNAPVMVELEGETDPLKLPASGSETESLHTLGSDCWDLKISPFNLVSDFNFVFYFGFGLAMNRGQKGVKQNLDLQDAPASP